MIKRIKQKLQGICIICSYQDTMTEVVQTNEDKFGKHIDVFNKESSYLLDGITAIPDVEDLIYNIESQDFKFNSINPKLINMILPKAFKGNPLFILDIAGRLLIKASKLVEVVSGELRPSPELEEMEHNNDWSGFNIPIRIEKILGNIIDNLDTKEIILLKHASVIGNLFDIDKLMAVNPFNTMSFSDLYAIILNLEVFTFYNI